MADIKKDLITARSVSIQFQTGDEVISPLNDVSFTLKSNSFNIVYGPSGSGKSTLLNVLTGLQPPTKGSVVFEGRDVYKLKPDELAHFRANQIGFVYQTNYWIKSLNVVENVSMPLYFLGYSRKSASSLAMKALDRIGMSAYAKKYPILLSGGEQQRIAVARALAHNPTFIIADEPTGSLDSKNGDFIMGLLEESRREQGRTVVLVTHNIEYLPLADNLLHIEDGRIKEMAASTIQATTDNLLLEMRNRIHALTKAKHHA